MRQLRLSFEDESYPVWLGADCLDSVIEQLEALGGSSFHVVTDRTVNRLHATTLVQKLQSTAVVHSWVIDDGERTKSIGTVERLAHNMLTAGADRSSVVVAVGGGVIGNVAGLVAALLFRGLRLVHVPTTLIAMADSVASLKQAVNMPHGKNLLGCFYTPTAVLADLSYLLTLPPVQIRSGMCEIIKNAFTVADQNLELVRRLLRPDARYDTDALAQVVEAGLLAKQGVMHDDRRECRAAILFEYGHTLGHAIEHASAGGITHGEAVALGMIAAAEIAHELGHLDAATRDLHYELIQRNGVTIAPPEGVSLAAVIRLALKDNKRGYVRTPPDQLAMILLQGIARPVGDANRPLTLVDVSLATAVADGCIFRDATARKPRVALCR
ncbi:iron-containing alcohol dehydrogenase [Sphingomonas zeae]